MERSPTRRSPFGLAGLGRFPVLWLGLVVCAVAAATYGIAGRVLGTPRGGTALSAPVGSIHGAAPGAHEFARQLAGMTNQFAALQRDDARVGKVDCVQASKGHYMCSFAVLRPSRPEQADRALERAAGLAQALAASLVVVSVAPSPRLAEPVPVLEPVDAPAAAIPGGPGMGSPIPVPLPEQQRPEPRDLARNQLERARMTLARRQVEA